MTDEARRVEALPGQQVDHAGTERLELQVAVEGDHFAFADEDFLFHRDDEGKTVQV
jgi:hypothetical protein